MTDRVNLAYAMRLEPADAIAYFKAKGYAISWNWWDVAENARAKAFWVSKATRQDLLQDFRDALTSTLEEGWTEREFIRALEPKLKAKGWWGKQVIVDSDGNAEVVQLGSPHRLRTIYRTNKFSAYQCGRLQRDRERAQQRPYWQYLAIMDSRTRPSHASLNGAVYRHDDPIWQAIYPPNGFNCRCRVRTLSETRLEKEELEVQQSHGQASTRMVEAGVDKHTGEVIFRPITEIKTPNGQIFRTDPGFNSAPCETTFDSRGHLPDAATPSAASKLFNKPVVGLRTYTDHRLPDARKLPPAAHVPMPAIIETSTQFDERLDALVASVTAGSMVRWVNTPGRLDPVPINRRTLVHIADPTDKPDISRTRYANFIIPTLQQPFEVWDTPYQDGTIRRRYLALFAADKTTSGGIGVVRINKDGTLLWTWYPARTRGLNRKRQGTLRYVGYGGG